MKTLIKSKKVSILQSKPLQKTWLRKDIDFPSEHKHHASKLLFKGQKLLQITILSPGNE